MHSVIHINAKKESVTESISLWNFRGIVFLSATLGDEY